MTREPSNPPDGDDESSDVFGWSLRLYVAGNSVASLKAIKNLNEICKKHLDDAVDLEVIDLLEHPELASEHQILAIPTLVRRLPLPVRKVIGDLSATDKVLVILDADENARG